MEKGLGKYFDCVFLESIFRTPCLLQGTLFCSASLCVNQSDLDIVESAGAMLKAGIRVRDETHGFNIGLVQRIENLVLNGSPLLLAHAFTRYLGDLSGIYRI